VLYEYIRERMLKHPNQVISNENKKHTYADVISQAEALGEKLVEEKYGILCDSDLDTAISLLACLYARKTAVILSRKYGESHLQRIIETIHLSYILTQNGVVKISESGTEKEDLSDVALIMCTSGTTGKPKGVMLTEDNLFANLSDIEKYFRIDESDHILIARPLYHCAVLTGELLISLIKGLRISFFEEGFIPYKLLSSARKKGVTVLCGTPTLLYHLSSINVKSQTPLSLRIIAVSGECMTEKAANIIKKAFTETFIYHVYGLTEASPRALYLPPDEFDQNPLSVGVPLDSLEAKIADNELLLKGKSIMKGYYNNPMETSNVLRDGWLHTGDLAEINDNGRFFIKGRRDSMIIRSGMNIYPSEIENAIKQDERISDALVYGIKKDVVGEKIYIKVVTFLNKAEVFDLCKKFLSTYQFPDEIEIVSEIPRNASGKVIRNAERYRD